MTRTEFKDLIAACEKATPKDKIIDPRPNFDFYKWKILVDQIQPWELKDILLRAKLGGLLLKTEREKRETDMPSVSGDEKSS